MPLGGRGGAARNSNANILNRGQRRGRGENPVDGRPVTRLSPPGATGDRESSPDKRHVSFDRRLERGPTPSSPDKRQTRSPSRSALSNRVAKQNAHAEQQLQAEMRSSTDGRPAEYHWQDTHGLDSDTSGHFERARSSSDEAAGYLLADQCSLEGLPLIDFQEEEERDLEVCRRVHGLRALVVEFAEKFASGFKKRQIRPDGLTRHLCRNAGNAQLIRYIGCLAYGGPNGVRDWDNLLAGPETVEALVIGIISTALKEHVFSALWLGGTIEQIEMLEKLEDAQKEGDGYSRTRSRAIHCRRFNAETAVPSKEYEAAKLKVKLALVKMMGPLYHPKQATQHISNDLTKELSKIVDIAGDLSREMRQCEDAIYYWPPTFKDDRMECLNLESMIKASPYARENANGHETTVLVGPPEQAEALVKIVAFPGLVVHRKGGGSLASRLLHEERSQQDDPRMPPDVLEARRRERGSPFNITGDEGFRTRLLCKSVVHLIWGRQRLLTREAGTSAHLDAMRDGNLEKYDDDRQGFIELYDYFKRQNLNAPGLF
ncbi:hypothetical protein Q7P37_004292 [Cladosporium fusiforme]